MKVVITDTAYPDTKIEQRVIEGAGLELEVAQCETAKEVVEAGRGASALLVQYAPVTEEVFLELSDLRLVSRYGIGVDNIDLDAARKKGVWVANVTDYGVEEVAAHATAMLLALVRRLPGYDAEVRQGGWDYQPPTPIPRLGEQTLGVAGCGRIGRLVARGAGHWFGRRIGYDPHLADHDWPEGIEKVESLEDLFSQSRAVSLHMPLTRETRGVVDRDLLARFDEASYLVNTARGGLVDLDDLLWALDSGKLAGAGLDVLPQEPPEPGHPVLKHPRVLLSPHAAWYSVTAEREVRNKAAANVVTWADGGRPAYVVVEGAQERSG